MAIPFVKITRLIETDCPMCGKSVSYKLEDSDTEDIIHIDCDFCLGCFDTSVANMALSGQKHASK